MQLVNQIEQLIDGETYQLFLPPLYEPIADLYRYNSGVFSSIQEFVSVELVEKLEVGIMLASNT